MYIPRPADLVFVKGCGPLSTEIERISGSSYSHVAGIVKPNELVEAQALRATGYQALDTYAGEYDIYTCDSLTDDERAAIVKWAIGQIGTPYNYADIGWEYFHYQFHMNLPSLSDRCYDCSDLWREAYQKSSSVNLRSDLEHVSPGDLALDKQLRKVELND